MESLEKGLEKYSKEDLKPMLEIKFVKYGECVGVIDDKGGVLTKPHLFYDGKEHVKGSGELCGCCYKVFRANSSEELVV